MPSSQDSVTRAVQNLRISGLLCGTSSPVKYPGSASAARSARVPNAVSASTVGGLMQRMAQKH